MCFVPMFNEAPPKYSEKRLEIHPAMSFCPLTPTNHLTLRCFSGEVRSSLHRATAGPRSCACCHGRWGAENRSRRSSGAALTVGNTRRA